MKSQTAKSQAPKSRTAKSSASKANTKSSTAVRGKYFNQLPKGTNLAIIDPALHAHFPDSESVNRALKAFLAIRQELQSAAPSTAKRHARAA